MSDSHWNIDRYEFAGLPDPPLQSSGALIDVYGGSGATMFARPKMRYDVVNFEFWEGSPGGWAKYLDKEEVIDCASGVRMELPGAAALLVHFRGAFRDDRFHGNPVTNKVVLDARQTCDRHGVLEWVIATRGRNPFNVESHEVTEGDFTYSVVAVSVRQ